MKRIIEDLRKDTSPSKIHATRNGKKVDLGLINQFALHEIIPNKWFDWERSQKAKYMVIGQDWGPYSMLKKLISDFDYSRKDDDKYYRRFLFKDFSSRTEKFILRAIKTTYFEKFKTEFEEEQWDNIIFTMSVLFTRKGKHFRGNHNFDPKQSFEISYPYVVRQIETVSPKVIITLGGMAFDVVNRHFNLGYKGSLTTIIKSLEPKGVITLSDGTKIIPNFHPASFTSPVQQMEIWGKIWE